MHDYGSMLWRTRHAYNQFMSHLQRVQLYLSTEHPCGYLPQRQSRNAYVDPTYALNPDRYARLIEQGFRRSGEHVYRPYCADCQKCLAARVPVERFRPDRSQQRCIRRNRDLHWRIAPSATDEHYDLFCRYIASRHAGEGMDDGNRESFNAFLECRWGTTQFWEFRDETRLLCVAVVDALPLALSAVYTFFEPEAAARGLGTYAVLQQIEQARVRGLEYVYLGYWVEGSRKMDYKRRYQPLEIFRSGGWEPLQPSG